MASWVIWHFRHKFRPKQLLPTPLAPCSSICSKTSIFALRLLCLFHRFPWPLPGWWLCIALWHWSNRSYLCQHPFLVLQTTAFQTIARSLHVSTFSALLSRSRELSRHPSSIPNPPPARRDKSGSQFIKSKVKHSNCWQRRSIWIKELLQKPKKPLTLDTWHPRPIG